MDYLRYLNHTEGKFSMRWSDWDSGKGEVGKFIDLAAAISIIAESVTALAAVSAAVIAALDLRTWINQLKGTTEYRITQDLLKRTFELRDALQAMRVVRYSIFDTEGYAEKELNELV